jgi:type II secretory pathway component HofQ
MRKTGNVLWIAPKDEIAAKEKLDLESKAAIQSLEPLRTQAFQLNYTKAADIAASTHGRWWQQPAAQCTNPQCPRQRDC